MLHKPNNYVKFQKFSSMNKKIIPHFVLKNDELNHFQAQRRKVLKYGDCSRCFTRLCSGIPNMFHLFIMYVRY